MEQLSQGDPEIICVTKSQPMDAARKRVRRPVVRVGSEPVSAGARPGHRVAGIVLKEAGREHHVEHDRDL